MYTGAARREDHDTDACPARPPVRISAAGVQRSIAPLGSKFCGRFSPRVAGRRPLTVIQRLQDEVEITGLFTALLDTLPDGVIVLNRHGVIVACNPSAERITGTPASRLVGSPSTSLFDKTRELPPGTLHLQYPVFDVSRSDGSRAWLSVITKPLRRDDQADAYGTLLCLADMTEKKLAEESFAEALSMRDLIAQASNDAIWDWDLQSDRIWWSEGLRAQFGHVSETATDREWWLNNVHPDDRQMVNASWISVFKSRGHVWLREFRFRTADGGFASVICRGHIVRAGDGRPVRMFGAMQDVSRQKRVEDDLHQSEELSRAVLSSLSARIGVLDRNGIIVEVNDDWRRFERDERPAPETSCLLGADYVAERGGLGSSGDAVAEEAQRGLRAVLRGSRRRADLEYKLDTPKGARWFAMHVEPLRTDRGGAVVSHVETTMRRLADEAEIRRLSAEQSEQAKTDLINVVSHELRTPLAVIRGHVTTVLEYGDRMTEARRRSSLEAADTASQQLERLVADLLTMGRLDAGVMRLECQPHSLEAILREAVEGVETIARQTIEIDLPDEPLEIAVDRSRMIQVFYNLLDNAVKYGKPGAPIRIEARPGEQIMALVMVENRSAGVRQADVDNIFERFYRTNHGMKLNVGGAGLGLSISKGIVEAHQGRIWARVRRGTFQVHLLLPKLPVSGGRAASV
ncbi:MAG: sensor histidine kinase [Dehalococcoidia bacterium]